MATGWLIRLSPIRGVGPMRLRQILRLFRDGQEPDEARRCSGCSGTYPGFSKAPPTGRGPTAALDNEAPRRSATAADRHDPRYSDGRTRVRRANSTTPGSGRERLHTRLVVAQWRPTAAYSAWGTATWQRSSARYGSWPGIVEAATQAEVNAEADDARYVTRKLVYE